MLICLDDIGNKRILTTDQESMLVDYLKTASKMCYGLTRHHTKKLAFDYAMANDICPDKWKETKNASDDWLKGFMSRHRDLAVRKPESTSLSRATSFNKYNVASNSVMVVCAHACICLYMRPWLYISAPLCCAYSRKVGTYLYVSVSFQIF